MNLTKKARFLARGNLVDPPQGITYSSVVSIYSVWILWTIDALNILDVHIFDIQTVYLNSETYEKFYFKTVTGFVPKVVVWKSVIVRYIYGLKYAR